MAKRHTSRQAARRGHGRAHHAAHQSRYRRKLRYEPLEHRQLLALVTVDTLDDTVDLTDGRTSLREAIFATNLVSGPDTIEFSPDLMADGPATIVLTQGELQIADNLTINGPGAELLTIDASGSDPTPTDDKGDGSSIFVIDDADEALLRDVSISGLTLTGSDALYGGAIFSSENLTITDSTIAQNFGQEFGGGIAVFGGQTKIFSSIVRDNATPNFGGGIAAFYAELIVANSTISGNVGRQGGGIYTTDGPLTVSDSHISGNKGLGIAAAGGGIHQRIGQMTITHTRIAGNDANAAGGIYSGDDATIVRSTITGNSAETDGGGILAFERLELRESTVSSNTAGEDGGGIRALGDVTIDGSTIAHNTAGGVGGGIWLRVEGGAALVQSSTISGNSSRDHGAGIWFASLSGTLPIRHSTIVVNNTSGSNAAGGGVFVEQGQLSLDHTIVAENSSRSGQDLAGFLGTAIKARFSLIGNNANSGLVESPFTGPDANGNQIGGPTRGKIDPRLGPLTNNGGPTQTHPPVNTSTINTSPAIDRGDPTAVAGMAGLPEFDQRGEPFRRIDGNVPSRNRIDIGAFEAPRTFSAFAVGDFNRSRTIDAADYVLWRNTRGQFVLDAVGSGADGNGDGYIDEADFMVWRSNFASPRLSIGTAAGDSLTIDDAPTTTVDDAAAAYVDSPAIAAGMADDSPVIVNTLFDVVDFNDGLTSLREAIFATNLVSGPDTIEFSPALTANGPATILLTQGELRITDDLAINGPGANRLTIDASGNDPTPDVNDGKGSRVLNIDDNTIESIEVSLSGVALRGGDISTTGGAIQSVENLVITSSLLVENFAAVSGGAIESQDGELKISSTLIAENASLRGAGIAIHEASLSMQQSTVAGNSSLTHSTSRGGGIYAVGAIAYVNDCMILNNTSRQGAGIYLNGGEMTVSQSTISGNYWDPQFLELTGVGIHSVATNVVIRDCAITENRASRSYGVFSSGGTDTHIENCTITDNSGGIRVESGRNTSVRNSLISSHRIGGVYINPTDNGIITISNATVSDNRGNGGVRIVGNVRSNATATVEKSTLSGNEGGDGGLRFLFLSSVIVDQCTITKNVPFDGGRGGVGGGGIVVQAVDSMIISESTLADNIGDFRGGGGIYASSTGECSIVHCVITGNYANEGGGLRIIGKVTIEDCIISGNSARIGGGVHGHANVAKIVRSHVTGNSASVIGGGVYASHASIVDCTIDGNSAGQRGGGIYAFDARIDSSTIHANNAVVGGGVWSLHTVVNQSTISGNQAIDGAGIGTSSDLSILHSTIAFNNATGYGGGVYSSFGTLTLDHSIIAGNTASTGSDIYADVDTSINSHFSLIGHRDQTALSEAPLGTPDTTGNLIGGPMHGVIDALLGPLADNAGPTMTHALLPGSPAINAGSLNARLGLDGVPLFDQRGEPFDRVANGRIDIGAFEFQVASDLNLFVDTLVDEADGNYERGDLSLREAVELSNQWPSTDTIQFDPSLMSGGPATVLLTHGELRLTDDLTINGPGADLLTIDASGNDPTPDIDDGKGSRVFNINDGLVTSIEVTFKDLSFTGGDALGVGGAIFSFESLVIESCIVVENTIQSTAFTGGGGIAASLRDGAHFEMSNSIVSNNQASLGGGILLIVGTNCTVRIDDSRISGNHVPLRGVADGGGIAIYDNLGSVAITDSEILDNSARNGGGIAFSGNVTIERSSISGNSSLISGGGIIHRRTADRFGALTLVDSEVANNTAENGGGIYLSQVASTPHKIVRSKILENTATGNMQSSNFGGYGGGILTSQGALKIVESTIEGNHARNGGGVAYFFVNAESLMENTTISRNRASIDGGGVWVGSMSAASLPLFHTTISANTADHAGGGLFASQGNVALNHSIVADNTAPSGRDLSGLLGATIQVHYTLIGSNQNSGFAEAPIGSPDARGNLVGGPTLANRINPGLNPLANNGGPTPTHALMPDSPAIDMGDPAAVAGVGGVPQFDQRGEPFTRVSGGRIDIGAFESQPNPLIGDYNFDGTVDSADYAVWRNTRNSTSDLRADGNGDSIVDDADRIVWRSNFGRTVGEADATEANDSLTIDEIPAATLDEAVADYVGSPSVAAGMADESPVIVNTLFDVVDFNDGRTSLREAIFATNLVSGPDTIEFSPALTAGGPATILLTQGELRITDDLTINGPGASLLTIDARGNDPTSDIHDGKGSRVFNIDDGMSNLIKVSLSGLTFTGGDVSGLGGAVLSQESLAIQDSTITGNFTFLEGGGIFANVRNGASIELTGLGVFENTVRNGDGGGVLIHVRPGGTATLSNSLIYENNCGDEGGGIAVVNYGGSSSINDSRIYDNQGGIEGGGIAFGGDLTIQRCSITGNSSRERGGGIMNGVAGGLAHGALRLIDSEVSNNSSRSGGGVMLFEGPGPMHEIVRSTISGNTASYAGGGVSAQAGSLMIVDSAITGNAAAVHGGGIYSIVTAALFSIQRCTISNNSAANGAGVWMQGGTILQSTISNNSAVAGGGINTAGDTLINHTTVYANTASGVGGGGLFLDLNTKAVISDSRISNNVSDTQGGGILNSGKELSIIRCDVSGNSADGDGGGIWNERPLFSIIESQITNNTANSGGGIWTSHDLAVLESLIANNIAHGNQANLEGAGNGGGILISYGKLAARNSTISGNIAQNGGGTHGTSLLGFCTVTQNIGGGVVGYCRFDHSIIAGNKANDGGTLDVSGIINSNFSLIGLGAESLGPLIDNGGPTLTHALLPSSPAIDAGRPATPGFGNVPLFDQRGEPFARMYGGWIDIGAFEWQPNPLTGDYNFDSIVDTADFVLWRNTRNSTNDLRADGNADGFVNDADRDIWRANFGRAYAAGSSPEIDRSDWIDRVDEVFQMLGSAAILTD